MTNDLILKEPELYFDSLHQELNNFLRDTFLTSSFANPLNMKKMSVWRPAIEVKQTSSKYKIRVQLPGVNKEDIQVDLDNDFLTISAEIQEETAQKEEEKEDEMYHTGEFRYGKYQRTISFDSPVNDQAATAEYKNGILKIIVPKQKTEKKSKKKIEIK